LGFIVLPEWVANRISSHFRTPDYLCSCKLWIRGSSCCVAAYLNIALSLANTTAEAACRW